jgi:hypothetical protein
MTYSWDRLVIDPLPGPRSPEDFSGLRQLAPNIREVLPSTKPISPAGSLLPRLAAELPARVLLLDPTDGAVGMAIQISAAAAYFHVQTITVIDVGGDALTDGSDQACAVPCRPARPRRLRPHRPAQPTRHSRSRHRWRTVAHHHSQAARPTRRRSASPPHRYRPHADTSRIHLASFIGIRSSRRRRSGTTRTRRNPRCRRPHRAHAATPTLFAVTAKNALHATPAVQLTDSSSLSDAETTIHEATGISEIRYETDKAVCLRNRPAHFPTTDDLPDIDQFAHRAHQHGADFISLRRLAELLGATTLEAFTALSALLASSRPDHYEPTLYQTH